MKRKLLQYFLLSIAAAIFIMSGCFKVDHPSTSITGFVYYENTEIPISDVLVSISEISSITGANGFYEIDIISQENQTIIATKEGYDTYSSSIQVEAIASEYNIEMTSAEFTHKLYGEIVNQIENSISGVTAVVLNPNGKESNLATTSSTTGYYQIINVPQGERTIRFKKENCIPLERNIFIRDSNYKLDVELQEYCIQCPEEPTVTYAGQIYNTVLIGDQCWLKQNLNVGLMIDGDEEMEDNEFIEKYCYNNNSDNCNIYGALYQWDEMMQYSTTNGSQGICPPNWHIPTDEEWKILEGVLDSLYSVGDPEWNKIAFRGFNAGERMKTEYAWHNNGGGNDMFCFSVLPSGQRQTLFTNNNFDQLGKSAMYWTSTEYNSSEKYYRYLTDYYPTVFRYHEHKSLGRSVRCVRN